MRLLRVTFGACLLPLVAIAADVRVHAIGYRHDVSHAESHSAYRDHLIARADAAIAADSAAPPDAFRVLVFPEDTALYAMFTGVRGALFRALEPLLRQGGGNGSSAAIAGLFAAYQAQGAYYRLKFPEQNFSQARLGLLALTDTIYRSFFETFRAIAIRHGAWVVSSANVAAAGITTDPAKVALLGDPEARDRPCGAVPPPCAYEATTANVYNQAFVFRPSGELVFNPYTDAREGDLDGAVKKTYLVPVEQGPLEQGKIGLDLAYGDLRQVRPIEIAGAPMGIVISKPAWMLDELGRLEAYDARVILQPEAFSSWGAPVSDWSPDVLKQSGWSHTQKYAPFRYSILAELTGNFFDLIFDAQNHIVRKATDKLVGAERYIGQPEDVGWVTVNPWVAGDGPGEACDRPRLGERRDCLAAFGEKLAPASGDPLENQYREDFASARLDLSPPVRDRGKRVPGALGASRPLDPDRARQRNPRAATGSDGSVYVVWQDGRTGTEEVRIARIDADGAIEKRTVLPTGRRQIFPQVAVTPAGVIHVVWQELEPSPQIVRTFAASFDDAFFPVPLPITLSPPIGVFSAIDEQWKPAIATDAAGRLHAAWIGLTGGFERLFYTRIDPDSGGFTETSALLDAEAFPAPEPLAERLNNRWNPAIAVRGDTVAIAWTDFRNYAWDLFATVSGDGGESFSPHRRADDSTSAHERLHNDPAVSIAEDGTVRVAWSDQGGRRAGCPSCANERRPDTDIAFAWLSPTAASFSPNVRVDDTGDGLTTGDRVGFSNQWRPALAADASGLLVAVWQDHREGNNDIYMALSDDGGAAWSENRRVDDTGGGSSNQFSPSIAATADGVFTVVWHDDRDGREQVYFARGKPPE